MEVIRTELEGGDGRDCRGKGREKVVLLYLDKMQEKIIKFIYMFRISIYTNICIQLFFHIL